eukprot:jgi/Undpi1/12644/HiC_scaffold_6.g02312.m1
MSASPTTADDPPATADSLAAGEGDSSPVMPPPPPFNTPAGTRTMPDKTEGNSRGGEGKAPVTTGSPEGQAGAALAQKLSGLSVAENGGGDGDAEMEGADGEVEEGDEEDEEGEENEVQLPREVMRRLYQLKALHSQKELVYDRYKAERAALERKFASEYANIYARRAEVVAGRLKNIDVLEVDKMEAGEGGESGVPHFWMQCMLHHEALHDVVCEPDLEALYYLSDVRCVDKDDLLGFTLQFHFDDNPFFSNAVLTKRYDTANIMDQGEPLLEGVDGTPIEWKSGRNLCEKVTRRKIKRGGSRSGETRTVRKVEKTESFFKFFQNPVMYDEDEEEEEDEDEEEEEEEEEVRAGRGGEERPREVGRGRGREGGIKEGSGGGGLYALSGRLARMQMVPGPNGSTDGKECNQS